jgi:hypothetical protein
MQASDLNNVRVGRGEGAAIRPETVHRYVEARPGLWIKMGKQVACGALRKPVIILRPFATKDP